MKRSLPFLAAAAGIAVIMLLLPLYRPAQPQGIRVTRGEARQIADRAARAAGIPVDDTWATIVWTPTSVLDNELRGHPRLADAWNDPVLGPRLDTYRVAYYYRGKDKYPPHGNVYVDGRTGEVTAARLRLRPEDGGGKPGESQLRPIADAFVRSHRFAGAPSPQFESARPTVLRGRTDWVFRYRVATKFPTQIVPYLNVYFAGDRFAGWDETEEYADGRQVIGEVGGEIAMALVRLATMFVVLLILLVIFLRKYHAGEVGVGSASLLFTVMLVLALIGGALVRVASSENAGLGSLDAATTSWAAAMFRLLLADIPSAVLLFLAWAVGESYASERWGDRLAAFEAVLRRDPFNATVGRSLLRGMLYAPLVAAAALGAGALAILAGKASPATAGGQEILFLGGPLYALVRSASDALLVPIAVVLFVLAWAHRQRLLWLGITASIVLGVIAGAALPPIAPTSMRIVFGFGAVVATIAVFLGYDLLTATAALLGASLIVMIVPLLEVASGPFASQLALTLFVPLGAIAVFAIAALLTRREVVYTHEDLAPHVRRIIERERVKAEIEAANRIQAALLPLDTPNLAGASVASHYRAATEIGGDYFDFLHQRSGEIGIAFGDVSGHGLTSGIVMAMAKSALLVQVDYDPSPRAVLEVLNEVVIRTAPKRILMTFFFGLLDPPTQTLRFASAGHHDPYVYRAATGKLEALSSWGFPLGVRRRDPFREHSVAFTPGDRLVLYSDGLIEAIDDDGEPFGFDRFEETITQCGTLSADEIKKALLGAVRKFTRNRPPEDDQTLVVVAFEHAVTRGAYEAVG